MHNFFGSINNKYHNCSVIIIQLNKDNSFINRNISVVDINLEIMQITMIFNQQLII